MPTGSDLTIHQFRVFDTVVRTGSLTRAALALDVPQPSISRIIARLEREVGTLLLNRSASGVTTTAAGERFHLNAIQAMHYHDVAIEEARAARGQLMGEVGIAAPDSVAGVLFAPLVRKIMSRHQAIRLRTIASQSSEIPALLASGTIDIGIVADTHALPPGSHQPLFREELYLVGPKSASLLQRAEVPLAEAARVPLVLNAMPGGFRSLIDRGFASLPRVPSVEIEIDANNALLDLLDDGAGFSILPYSIVASACGRGTLAASRLVDPNLVRTLYMLTAPNRPVRSVAREVMRRIRSVVAEKSRQARWYGVEPE